MAEWLVTIETYYYGSHEDVIERFTYKPISELIAQETHRELADSGMAHVTYRVDLPHLEHGADLNENLTFMGWPVVRMNPIES